MGSSRRFSKTSLTPFSFCSALDAFVLTGGAALVGFKDLDLFTHDVERFHAAIASLPAWSTQHGFTLAGKVDSPSFRRVVLSRGSESVVVNLVHDLSPQLGEPAVVVDGIALESLRQIFVNKIATLVGRQEERDVVDIMAIERLGLRVEDFAADG